MKNSSATLFLMLLLVGGPVLADNDASPAAPPALTPAQQQVEIDGAKAAVMRLESVKKLSDLGPCLTNDSAGFLGMKFGASTVRMASYISSQAPQPRVTPLQRRLNGILARNGVSADKTKTERAMNLHGRALFLDVAQLLATLPNGMFMGMNRVSTPPADLNYVVVSPTLVKITSRSEPKDNIDARFEDGQWRLEILSSNLTNIV